jgi:hypothetical protein
VQDPSELINELPGYVKGGEFPDLLSDYYLLTKNSAPWGLLDVKKILKFGCFLTSFPPPPELPYSTPRMNSLKVWLLKV